VIPQDSGVPEPPSEAQPTPPIPPIPPMPVEAAADGTAWAVQPPLPRKRRRWPWVTALVAAVLLIGGGAAAFVMLRGSSEELLTKIPAQSDIVAVAYLNPSAGQKVNLLRLANRFPQLGSSQKIRDQVNKSLDSALASTGLDHTDVSWVGSEVAVSVDVGSDGQTSAALLLVTSDEAAARASLEKIRKGPMGPGPWTTEDHGGVQVSVSPDVNYAVFDGIVVIGAKSAVENIIDTDQGKLAALDTSAEFKTTMADLPTGKLGFFYMDPSFITKITQQNPAFQTGALGPLGTDAVKGLAITISAQSDGIQVDTSTRYDPSKLSPDQRAKLSTPQRPSALLSSVPADAYGLISLVGLDKSIKAALNQSGSQSPLPAGVGDLLDSLSGDLAIEVSPSGSGTPLGAIIIGSKNDALMQSSLDQIASGVPRLLRGSRWQNQTYAGATIRYLTLSPGDSVGLPAGISPAYAVVNGEVVIASSLDAIHGIIDTAGGGANISTNASFVAAFKAVPTGGTFLFFDVQRILAEVRKQLPPDMQGSFDKSTGSYFQPVQWVAVGSGSDATHDRQRIFIRIP
jgi:Protein of unknown function (DUF3352)